MKKRLFLGLLLLFVSLAGEHYIILTKGQFKSIELPITPTADYSWQIKSTLYDFLKRDENSPVQLIMEGFGNINSPQGIGVGQATQSFNFAAKNSGTITITFEYKQRLATAANKTETITFQVN